jgi:LPXTG-motif cell wall-anchored protein
MKIKNIIKNSKVLKVVVLISTISVGLGLMISKNVFAANNPNTIDLVLGQVQKNDSLEVSICVKSQLDNINLTNVTNWLEYDTTKLTPTTPIVETGDFVLANGYTPIQFDQVLPNPATGQILNKWSLRLTSNAGFPIKNISKTNPELFGKVKFDKSQLGTSQSINIVKNQYFFSQSSNPNIPADINLINSNFDCRDTDGDGVNDTTDLAPIDPCIPSPANPNCIIVPQSSSSVSSQISSISSPSQSSLTYSSSSQSSSEISSSVISSSQTTSSINQSSSVGSSQISSILNSSSILSSPISLSSSSVSQLTQSSNISSSLPASSITNSSLISSSVNTISSILPSSSSQNISSVAISLSSITNSSSALSSSSSAIISSSLSSVQSSNLSSITSASSSQNQQSSTGTSQNPTSSTLRQVYNDRISIDDPYLCISDGYGAIYGGVSANAVNGRITLEILDQIDRTQKYFFEPILDRTTLKYKFLLNHVDASASNYMRPGKYINKYSVILNGEIASGEFLFEAVDKCSKVTTTSQSKTQSVTNNNNNPVSIPTNTNLPSNQSSQSPIIEIAKSINSNSDKLLDIVLPRTGGKSNKNIILIGLIVILALSFYRSLIRKKG